MALAKCPECGKEVSDRAKVCTHCGYPLQKGRRENIRKMKRENKPKMSRKDTRIILILLFLLCCAAGLVFWGIKNEEKRVNSMYGDVHLSDEEIKREVDSLFTIP